MVSKRQALLDYLVADAGPLKQITVANGYENNVALVQRGQRDVTDLADSDYPCIFIAGTDDFRKNITHNQFTSELVVEIIGGMKSAGVSGLQSMLDTLIADVTEALEGDRLQGGRCHNTWVRRISTDRGDLEAHAIFLMEVVFSYATEGGNP